PYPNAAPAFDSQPIETATVGQPYRYQAAAHDPDGTIVSYVLHTGPKGLVVDPASGLVRWTPDVASPALATIVLQVYDARGGHATQEFIIAVTGTNRPPALDPIPVQFLGQEGQPLEIVIQAADPENDRLVYWADGLPPGAVFDPTRHVLAWAPGSDSA